MRESALRLRIDSGVGGQETVALFNYDRNEAITVRLNGREYAVEPNDVLFLTLP